MPAPVATVDELEEHARVVVDDRAAACRASMRDAVRAAIDDWE